MNRWAVGSLHPLQLPSCPSRNNSAAEAANSCRGFAARIACHRIMAITTSKLAEKLLIIYEMDGRDAVEQYARANGIPLAVCSKIISDYEVARGLRALAAGR